MFTIKYFQPADAGPSQMVIESADKVEEAVGPTGKKYVRLIRHQTGLLARDTFETIIIMDEDGKTGPSSVFVENLAGKTVQRIAF